MQIHNILIGDSILTDHKCAVALCILYLFPDAGCVCLCGVDDACTSQKGIRFFFIFLLLFLSFFPSIYFHNLNLPR